MIADDIHTSKIGFLGLGSLGAPIAERLASGSRVLAFDPDPKRLSGLKNIESLSSPREIADFCDIIFACLAEKEHHHDALLGEQGILHGHRCKTYVHLGTSGSQFLNKLAEQLSAAGIATIDAPVTGGPPKARCGELTSIVAGNEVHVAAVGALVKRYSSKIVYAGMRPGQSQTIKLVNNAIALTNFVAACEAMVVGARAGINGATMLEVINSGSGQSHVSLDKFPHHVLPRSFDFGATLAIVIKDIELFLAEPAAQSMSTDTCRSALQAFRRAQEEGVEVDDLTAVIRPMERRAGVEVR